MPIERINPDGLRRSGSSSQVVRAGDIVHIAAQGPFSADGSVVGIGDANAQADRAFQALETALGSVGGGLEDLLRIAIFVTRPEHVDATARAREEFLPMLAQGARPAASTTVVVPAQADGDALVQIDATAVVGAGAADHQVIDPPELWKAPGHPHGAKTGTVIHVTGQMGREAGRIVSPGDAAVQAAVAYEHLSHVLRAAGASRADVARHLTYYTHPVYYDAVQTAQEQFYGADMPACTSVCVWALGTRPEAAVEIEVTAVLGGLTRPAGHSVPGTAGGADPLMAGDGTAYIPAQIAVDGSGTVVGVGDVSAQLDQVYRNLDAALRAVGAKRSGTVRTTTYITQPSHAASLERAAAAFYGSALPANTTIAVLGLPDPACRVAIEAIAVAG